MRRPRSSGSGSRHRRSGHAGELGAFLTAVDQLRKAQLGRGGGGVNQAATRQRNALRNLVALATGILIAAHLAEEHTAPGFEAFAGVAPAARHERPTPAREKPQREPRVRPPSREQERAAERAGRSARAHAAKLERDASRRRQRVEKAAK